MAAVILYAFRDWFVSLCALIVFTALTDYPGLPNPLETKGINHWSVMLAAVTLAWALDRLIRPRSWSIPRGWIVALGMYLLVELIGVARLCVNLDAFKERAAILNPAYSYYSVRAVIVDIVYSPMRYTLLGFLLFDGIRTRRHMLLGLIAVLAAVFVYAWIVNKEVPLSGLVGGGMEYRRRIGKWTGRNPNDLARVFVAAFWIGVALLQLRVGSSKLRTAALFGIAFVMLALAHTNSRGGYLGFVTTGLVLSVMLRSWRTLAVLSCILVAVIVFAPGITGRMLMGVDTSGEGQHDMGTLTAGRDVIWPAALEGISAAPLVGYGVHGYVMSPAILVSISNGGGELHPHNAYLEALLDHGVLLCSGRLAPFVYMLVCGAAIVSRRSDPVCRLIGVTALAWGVATLSTGLTGQHWGFTENLFTFWCVTGLTARVTALPYRTPRMAPSNTLSRRSSGRPLVRAMCPAAGGRLGRTASFVSAHSSEIG